MSSYEILELQLADPAATDRLGHALSTSFLVEIDAIRAHGLQLALSGDLGAGKTALVRAVLRGLGEAGPVKSPSFSLLEPYVVSSLDFYHFDFYRLGDAGEFESAGFREYFGPARICAVEWPEKAAGRLPAADLAISLRVAGEGRTASLAAGSELGHRCLKSALWRIGHDGS